MQRFYFKVLMDNKSPHPISKGEPGHPAKEAHFSCLDPVSLLVMRGG